MELNDFQQPKMVKEDFDLEGSPYELAIPVKSAATLAAGDTIMSGEPSLDEYRKTREGLLSHEGRQGYIIKHEQRRQEILNSYKRELQDILLDPEIPEGQKAIFIDGVRVAPRNFRPSENDIMVEQAIMHSSDSESEAAHEVRLSMTDMISEVNNHKRDTAAQLNAVAAKRNPDFAGKAVDFAEVLAPFTEWINVDTMYRALVGEDANLMGNQKDALFGMLQSVPYNKRAELTEKIIDYVEAHDQVIFPDGNDLIALENLHQILLEDNYSDYEKWFDNLTSVMEATGVLAAAAPLFRGGKAAKLATRSGVSPTSPSQLMKDANPDRTRNAQAMAATDETGEAAEGLYGATREDAVAKDVLPEPEFTEGHVENKVIVDEPDDLVHLRTSDGQTYLSKDELQRIRGKVVSDFSDVEGFRLHKESMTIKTNDNGTTNISTMYHPKDAGYKTPQQALDSAKYALRHYGVDDENLTLYRREGSEWVETDLKELDARAAIRDQVGDEGLTGDLSVALGEIDYAVGIKYDYTFRPEDLTGYDLLSTGKAFGLLPLNILDRATPLKSSPAVRGQGSLTQNFLDSSSVLHPQIVEPALVAVDREVALKKAYVETFEEFTNVYKKLPKDRRVIMSDYINEANHKGLPFDTVDLKSRGFDDKEIAALRTWRNSNDFMFHAMNDDMAKTLRNRGVSSIN